MALHSNPLVVLAAAAAAAELALNKRSVMKSGALPSRLEALDVARVRWEDAKEKLLNAQHNAASSEHAAAFLGFSLRAEMALASLPAMSVIARCKDAKQVPAEDLESATFKMQQGWLRIGASVMERNNDTAALIEVKRGVAGEVATQLLLQRHRPLAFLFIPASMRQDHNRTPWKRADLVGVEAAPPYRRTLIQVTSQERPRRKEFRVIINAHNDLALGGAKGGVFRTLKVILAHSEDALQDWQGSEELADLSQYLMKKCTDGHPER